MRNTVTTVYYQLIHCLIFFSLRLFLNQENLLKKNEERKLQKIAFTLQRNNRNINSLEQFLFIFHFRSVHSNLKRENIKKIT